MCGLLRTTREAEPVRSALWFLHLVAAWGVLYMAAPAAAQNCREVLDRSQKAFEGQRYSVAETSMMEALESCPKDRLRIYVSLGQVQ